MASLFFFIFKHKCFLSLHVVLMSTLSVTGNLRQMY